MVQGSSPAGSRHACRRAGPAFALAALVALVLAACGGSVSTSPRTAAPQLAQATSSTLAVAGNQPGASPFISFVTLSGAGVPGLAGIEFTIAPRPGSVSRAVDVYYSMAALVDRGDVALDGGSVQLPVFGLYAGYENQVSLLLHFQDGSTRTLAVALVTPAYVDPSGTYGQPTIVKQRAAGSALGFDFLVMKSALGSPVIVDTDAQIRWVAPGVTNSSSTAIQDDEFIIGDAATPTVYRLRLDGTLASVPLQSASYTMFHHNIDPGKHGLLAEVNTAVGTVVNLESTVAEIDDQGAVLKQWDLAAILSAYMSSQSDDASAFVRPGADWFHNNATTYDPSDDSLIVSSRENFVIKLDYASGNIIWILGDPTKYWYTFPSLRAKALTLAPGGLYPLGQHATTITSDGLLMLFNDGLGSVSQPAGAPAGASRTYSAVSAYSIDEASMTAQNVWNFDYGQTLYSKICSSAYEARGQSILVDYAVPDNYAQARLVGLDANHDVVFDFEYPQDPTAPCSVSWNALPIALDNLVIY
jgi:arylsulfate sulfotransferase